MKFYNKFTAALFLGASLALAFAPFYFFPFALISLSGFYFLLENEEQKKQIFWLGFFYGFGFFLAGNYWIAISLLVDWRQFAWLIPFALTLIPAALALYLALFALLYKTLVCKFSLKKNYQKIFLFASCWIFFEFLRAKLFTGFPWNLLGYVWMFKLEMAQLASVFGIYGLSFLAILIALLPSLFWRRKADFSDKIFAVFCLILLGANFVFGTLYIDEKKIIQRPQSKLRLVQQNLQQEMKWDADAKYKNFLEVIELTKSRDLADVKAVIWSETSVPYALDKNSELLVKLKSAVPPQGLLITGALRFEQDDFGDVKNVWNSVFAIDEMGIAATYDKHHLVPFGEYIPLQKFLPFVEKITDGALGFSQGEGAQSLDVQGLRFSPLICYEAIFFDEVTNKKSAPDLFVNLTNDAWFGVSSGPFQHLDMVRMRAIENGIPLARVASTGVSAFIDPFGRIIKKIDLGKREVVDVDLVEKIEPTIFLRYDHRALILLLLIASVILFLIQIKTSRRQK